MQRVVADMEGARKCLERELESSQESHVATRKHSEVQVKALLERCGARQVELDAALEEINMLQV